MSKPRYDWWPYVKGMIRSYPVRKAEYDTHVFREMERVSIRKLPSTRQREYEAVRRAVEQTMGYANGKERLAVVDMVFWKRSCTVLEAAALFPLAREWHKEFILLTAANYGLLEV